MFVLTLRSSPNLILPNFVNPKLISILTCTKIFNEFILMVFCFVNYCYWCLDFEFITTRYRWFVSSRPMPYANFIISDYVQNCIFYSCTTVAKHISYLLLGWSVPCLIMISWLWEYYESWRDSIDMLWFEQLFLLFWNLFFMIARNHPHDPIPYDLFIWYFESVKFWYRSELGSYLFWCTISKLIRDHDLIVYNRCAISCKFYAHCKFSVYIEVKIKSTI